MKRKELKRTPPPPKKPSVNERLTKQALSLALENANISLEAKGAHAHCLQLDNDKLERQLRIAQCDLDAARISEGVLRARLNEIHTAAVNAMLGIVPKGLGRAALEGTRLEALPPTANGTERYARTDAATPLRSVIG